MWMVKQKMLMLVITLLSYHDLIQKCYLHVRL